MINREVWQQALFSFSLVGQHVFVEYVGAARSCRALLHLLAVHGHLSPPPPQLPREVVRHRGKGGPSTPTQTHKQLRPNLLFLWNFSESQDVSMVYLSTHNEHVTGSTKKVFEKKPNGEERTRAAYTHTQAHIQNHSPFAFTLPQTLTGAHTRCSDALWVCAHSLDLEIQFPLILFIPENVTCTVRFKKKKEVIQKEVAYRRWQWDCARVGDHKPPNVNVAPLKINKKACIAFL